jgi:tetrahydromethanopterin S-methyltransferase subunit B
VATYDVALIRRIPTSSGSPTLSQIAPIKWTGLSISREVGAPGRLDLSCTVDSLDSAANAALLDLSVTPCELWCYRDGTQIHAGPILNYQIQGRKITLYSPGLLAYVGYMVRDTAYTVTATEQATIVAALIAAYQAQTYGDFGIDTTHLTATGTTRDLTLLASDLKPIDAVLKEMGQRANGFDLAVDPANRRLVMYSPRQGTDLSASVILDRRSISDPSYSQSVGPGQIASDVAVSGSSAATGNLVASASNITLRTSFGRVMMTASFSDVSEQATLNDHASRLLDDSDSALHGLAPGLLPVAGFEYDDFGPGDIVTYNYDAGLGEQTFTPRVRSVVVALDKGTERFAVGFF